jgi:hypothetical protein
MVRAYKEEDAMKKGLALGLLVILGVAAYFFGPQLYQRVVPPASSPGPPSQQARPQGTNPRAMTPWGKITTVEAVDVFQDENTTLPIRPQSGHRLWVLRLDFGALPPAPATAGKQPDDAMARSRADFEESFLVDTTGEKHPFHWGRLSSDAVVLADAQGQKKTVNYLELITYSMPRDRQPRVLRLGDGSDVELP